MSNIVHLGDIGTVIDLTIKDEGVVVSLVGATTLQMLLHAPSGVIKTVTAELVTDGTDGRIRYVTEAADIDEANTWRVQAYVVTPTWTGHSSKERFTVFD